jgi:hypothetical protein
MAKNIRNIAILGLLILILVPASVLNGQTDESNRIPQYLFPVFSKGIIKMKDGRNMTAILDYNTVDEEMVFAQNGKYMVLEKPDEIDTIILQNKLFIPLDREFLEVVVKGNVSLFIQHKSKYVPKASTSAYGVKTQNLGPSGVSTVKGGNQFRSLDVPDNVTVSASLVFWARINGEMNKFLNEKQFLKLFPDKEAEIKAFIKKAGADIKTREGLVMVGNFLNSK